MKKTSVHVPDGVEAVIDELVRQSGGSLDVPTLTQADVTRLLLRDGCDRLIDGDLMIAEETAEVTGIDAEVLADLIPTSARAKFLYNERKTENWFADMKGGFEGRVRDRLEKRFGSGYDPEAAEELAENYIGEAYDFWVRIEDDRETFEEKKQFVIDRLDDYRRKFKTSEYDPNEEFLAGYSGVQEGEAQAEVDDVREQVRAVATKRIEEGSGVGTAELAHSIAVAFDVDEDVVEEIVAEIKRESMIADQRRAEGVSEQAAPALMDGTGYSHDGYARAPDADREPQEIDGVVLDDDEAEDLFAARGAETDGGVDEGDGPRTDGGREVASPGTERYWSDLADAQAEADGGSSSPTVRERIVEQLDAEQIHGLTVTARRGTTTYAVVSASKSMNGREVVDLRTVVIDLGDDTVKVSRNGLWIPRDAEALDGLTKTVARTTSDVATGRDDEPALSSIDEVDVTDLLATEVKPDDYDPTGEWGEEWGNGQGPPPETYQFVERLVEADVETERFSRLDFGAKSPFERYAGRPASELLGNYGVETIEGDPLIVIDVDEPDDAPLDALPTTYAVSSPHGDDRRAHHFYRVEDADAVAEHFGSGAVKPGWGDVWISGEYVVGPGSKLVECNKDGCTSCGTPEGGRYSVVADEPIASLDADALIDLLETSWSREDVAEQDVEPEPVEDDDDGEDDDEHTVECHDCGEEIPDEDAQLADRGGTPVYVCGGGCE